MSIHHTLKALRHWVREWRYLRRQQALRDLGKLNDQQLRDIGLNRPHERRVDRWWRAPTPE